MPISQDIKLRKRKIWVWISAATLWIIILAGNTAQWELRKADELDRRLASMGDAGEMAKIAIGKRFELAEKFGELFSKAYRESAGGQFSPRQVELLVSWAAAVEGTFNLVSLIGPTGDLIYSSKPFSKINLADREHFYVPAKDISGQVFISRPVLGRVSQHWSIQVAKRIVDASQNFIGVSVVTVEPKSLMLTGAKHGSGQLLLVGVGDGILRADLGTGSEAELGSSLPEWAWPSIKERSSGAVKISTNNGDILLSWTRIDGTPLAVVGIADQKQIIDSISGERLRFIFWAIVRMAVVFFVALGAIAMLTRLSKERSASEEASRMKSIFLANVSHDLRTPINGMLGYSQLLSETLTDPDLLECAQIIEASATHLLETVNDLLDLAKIEAGKIEIHAEWIDVRELLDSAAGMHFQEARKKGLKISVNASDGILNPGETGGAQIYADKTRMIQILSNLISNSIKFTTFGRIELGYRYWIDQNSIELFVRDTGCGIPSHELDKIWLRWERGAESGSGIIGTGIGLALVRQLSLAQGGRVSIESEVGTGTSVFVSFSGPAMRIGGKA